MEVTFLPPKHKQSRYELYSKIHFDLTCLAAEQSRRQSLDNVGPKQELVVDCTHVDFVRISVDQHLTEVTAN